MAGRGADWRRSVLTACLYSRSLRVTRPAATALGPATNWRPSRGPHHGRPAAAKTALPHREPGAGSGRWAAPKTADAPARLVLHPRGEWTGRPRHPVRLRVRAA